MRAEVAHRNRDSATERVVCSALFVEPRHANHLTSLWRAKACHAYLRDQPLNGNPRSRDLWISSFQFLLLEHSAVSCHNACVIHPLYLISVGYYLLVLVARHLPVIILKAQPLRIPMVTRLLIARDAPLAQTELN
jgi:hypothetical protein